MRSNGILLAQEMLYERLSNHPNLLGKVRGIFEDLPDQQEMPYVAFGGVASTDNGLRITGGDEILQSLVIYGGSKGEIGEVVYEIQKALEVELVIPKYDCHLCRLQSIETISQVNEGYEGKIQIKLKITEVL